MGMTYWQNSYLAAAFLFLFFSLSYAAYPSGLVSYWPFDSNANDAMGINNGTVSGAALTSTGGQVSGSYVFNPASNAYISVANPASLPLGSSPRTMLVWFKKATPAISGTTAFLGGYGTNSNGNRFGLALWSSGLAGFEGANLVCAASVSAADTNWHLLAAVLPEGQTNAGSVQIYFDGVYSPCVSVLDGTVNTTQAPLQIGVMPSVGLYYFNGSIDEVALFNRSLSASEISQYYDNSRYGVKNYFGDCRHACASYGPGSQNDGATLAATSLYANMTVNAVAALKNFTFSWNGTNYSFFDPSLVAMWSFEDSSYSDNFNSASLDSGKWTGYATSPGAVAATGSVLRLSGPSTGAYLDSGAHSEGKMTFKGDFDIQADFLNFAKPTSSSGGASGIWIYTPGWANAFYMARTDSQLYASDAEFGGVWGGYSVSTSTTATSGKFRITRVGTTMSAYYWSGSSWTLLRTLTNAAYSQDMFVVFHSYHTAPTSAYSIDFDNFIVNSGQLVSDSSASANNGVLSGSLSQPEGKYGSGVLFSGNSSYITVPYSASLSPTSALTVSAWFNARNLTSQQAYGQRIISKTESGGYHISISENSACAANTLCFLARNSTGYYSASYPVANLSANTWYHVVGTYDGTTIRLYLQGNQVATSPMGGSLFYTYSNALCIGSEPYQVDCTNGGSNYFNGTIDEVRIYNRALSAAEVKQLYLSNLKKINSTAWEFVTNQTNLADGTYAYAGYSTDTQGYTDSTGVRSVTLAYNPVVSTYGGSTTNFATVADITNVTNLTLEKPGAGKIKFPPAYSINAAGADFDSQVIIGNGFVSVNTSALHSSFNSTATLTMNLTGIYSGASAPTIYYYEQFASSLATILANGAVCSAPRCTGISWDQASGILAFNVTGFSDYGVNGSGNFTGAGGSPSNSTGTLGINITSTSQVAVYTSGGQNNSLLSFVPVTPPAAGSITLMSNESSNVTGGFTGFLVENQGNVNVSINVTSDRDAASLIGGSSPQFQMFGAVNKTDSCPGLDSSPQNLSSSGIVVCPSLAFSDSGDVIWAYVLVKIDSDSPPQTSNATLTFTITPV
ncbi:MAG: LamG domain-containing protein [Candidatus Micrarchaeia archaeon]